MSEYLFKHGWEFSGTEKWVHPALKLKRQRVSFYHALGIQRHINSGVKQWVKCKTCNMPFVEKTSVIKFGLVYCGYSCNPSNNAKRRKSVGLPDEETVGVNIRTILPLDIAKWFKDKPNQSKFVRELLLKEYEMKK